MKRRRGLHGDFIEAEKGTAFVRRFDDALEHEMAGDAVLAARYAGETVAQLGGAEVGEKAELAEIDAEDGRLLIAHLPGGAQDGAVAAEDEGKVGGQTGEIGLLMQVAEDDVGVFAQKRREAFGLFGDAGTMCVAEDEDTHRLAFPRPIRSGRWR